MHWNYRVLKKDDLFALHSVYYDDAGKILGWSESPDPVIDEDFDYLKTQLTLMLEALEKEVKISFDSKNVTTTIHADEARLQQVIDNLLSNAINFTNKGNIIVSSFRGTEDTNGKIDDSNQSTIWLIEGFYPQFWKHPVRLQLIFPVSWHF